MFRAIWPAQKRAFVELGGFEVAVLSDDGNSSRRIACFCFSVPAVAIPGRQLQISRDVIRFVMDSRLDFLECYVGLAEVIVRAGYVSSGKRNVGVDVDHLRIELDDVAID